MGDTSQSHQIEVHKTRIQKRKKLPDEVIDINNIIEEVVIRLPMV